MRGMLHIPLDQAKINLCSLGLAHLSESWMTTSQAWLSFEVKHMHSLSVKANGLSPWTLPLLSCQTKRKTSRFTALRLGLPIDSRQLITFILPPALVCGGRDQLHIHLVMIMMTKRWL